MSGGVDSSVAAYLLTQQYTSSSTTVFGLFLQNWSPQDEIGSSSSSYCEASERDRRDAENVCQHIGIPLHTANFGELTINISSKFYFKANVSH